jgi:hypothetical protein
MVAEGPKGLRIGGIICYDGVMRANGMHGHSRALKRVMRRACTTGEHVL